MKNKLEKVLDKNAKNILINWDIKKFKKSHPSLFKAIINSMEEIQYECINSLEELYIKAETKNFGINNSFQNGYKCASAESILAIKKLAK